MLFLPQSICSSITDPRFKRRSKRPPAFHGRSVREFVDRCLNCHMSQTCSFCSLHLPVIWATRSHLQFLSFHLTSIQSSGSSGDSLPKHVHNPSVLSSPLRLSQPREPHLSLDGCLVGSNNLLIALCLCACFLKPILHIVTRALF